MAKFFPSMNVAEMDFDCGQLHTGNGIAQRIRVVGKRAWVDQDAIGPFACLVDKVDERTFVVALEYGFPACLTDSNLDHVIMLFLPYLVSSPNQFSIRNRPALWLNRSVGALMPALS